MSRHDKRRATFGLAYHLAPPRLPATMERAVEAMRVLVEVRARIIAGFLEMMTRVAEDARRPEWGES